MGFGQRGVILTLGKVRSFIRKPYINSWSVKIMSIFDKSNAPEWIGSQRFKKKFIQVRHTFLILFQILGFIFLIVVCLFLFSDLSGYTDEISTTTPLKSKLWLIAFLIFWNLGVYLMLRHSSKILDRIKQAENAQKSAGGDVLKDAPQESR
jgi:hypothetical protein